MPLRQQVVFLALTGLLLLVILELVRRRRLRVEYSWVWLASGASIVLLILRYDLLLALTETVGAVVPTSTLFFLCILFLAALCLDFSVRLTTLTRQVKDLAQELALLRHSRGEPAPPTALRAGEREHERGDDRFR
ncbi:MAG: DUF2304 domain-containing protein [Vicinamibacteria bacterium]|jgi:hypothetical protein|nr:DUF2304 domain-containing protein [Vicinamibacteria bacterium]